MASETVDPIDWSHPPPYTSQYPLSSTYCPLQCGLQITRLAALSQPRTCDFRMPDQRTAGAATQGISLTVLLAFNLIPRRSHNSLPDMISIASSTWTLQLLICQLEIAPQQPKSNHQCNHIAVLYYREKKRCAGATTEGQKHCPETLDPDTTLPDSSGSHPPRRTVREHGTYNTPTESTEPPILQQRARNLQYSNREHGTYNTPTESTEPTILQQSCSENSEKYSQILTV